jgi:hypothetical protein
MATVWRVGPVLAAAAVVTAGLVALAGSAMRATPAKPPEQVLTWTKGACVSRSGERYDLTPCNGGDAEVVTVAPEPLSLGGCPDDSDDVVSIGGGRLACVRNFLDPHPGAPGGGGGVLRAGDCLAVDGRERPCSTPGWYGRAVAIAREPAGCPADTLDTLTPGPVACLGAGGQVLDQGMCVAKPSSGEVTRAAIERVGCETSRAWARVLSFERTAGGCPKGSDRYLEARGAYRPVTCLHLVSK